MQRYRVLLVRVWFSSSKPFSQAPFSSGPISADKAASPVGKRVSVALFCIAQSSMAERVSGESHSSMVMAMIFSSVAEERNTGRKPSEASGWNTTLPL